MSSETSTSSNTTSSGTFTQEQLQEASGVYRSAVFDFYEGYTNTYNAAIQAGANPQRAAINGLEEAHRAASQAFTDAYTAANAMGSQVGWAGFFAHRLHHPLDWGGYEGDLYEFE